MSDLPSVPRPELAALRTLVDEAFADDGPLAKVLPAFEPRHSQREMAAATADIFEDGGVLLAEAGTGTGKTLAYLVPAILSRQRVLISTGTKNLQDQIKEFPERGVEANGSETRWFNVWFPLRSVCTPSCPANRRRCNRW